MTVSGRVSDRIAAIAAAQRGRVARRQLRAAGISETTVDRLVARGQLHPLHRGVFCVGHQADVELGDETAALLAVRDGAALSHYSAALRWELVKTGDGLIHILVARSKGAQLPGVTVHRSRNLASQDVAVHKRLPVTSPARTLLDLAHQLPARQLELAFDRALTARIMYRTHALELLSRSQGHPGHGALRALTDREGGSTITRSEAEERFLALIRGAQLPEPLVNRWRHGFELDFYWPEHKLVVEIDGFRFHSTRRAFEHDHRKDAALNAARIAVIRFTRDQVKFEPLIVLAAVVRALAR